MPRIIKTADERIESSKIACSKYYYNNKERINQDPHRKAYNARFQRLTYDDAKKSNLIELGDLSVKKAKQTIHIF